MSTDYSEIFCTAVDEIVSAKLAGLEYDITKTCTIIDDSNKKTGKYRVSSGAAKFDAYAVAGEYSNGETVLVTIPNGNYDLQKIIVGRSVAETKIPTKYTSPLSEMTQIKDYTFSSNQSASLLANASTEGSVADIGINITRTDLTGFTKLGVSADFKAWLLDMDTSSGDYGLKIVLEYEGMLAQGQYGTKYETLYFKASDMIGNPYGFESFYSQEKVFDISHINTVKNVTIQLYQRDNFKDSNGALIPSKGYNYNSLVNREFTEIEYNLAIEAANTNLDVLLRTLNLTETEALTLMHEIESYYELSDFIDLFIEGFSTGSPMENNLFAKNVKLYFGYEANIFTEDNKLILYTNDGLTYHYTKDNNKRIYIRWIHKIKDGVYEILDNNEVDFNKHKVRWFKENIGYTPPEGEELDPYAGANWEPLVKGEGLESLEYIFLPRAGDETTAGVQEEKVKAIVIYKTSKAVGFDSEELIQIYNSDILTFKNEEKAADSQAFAGSTIFKIVCRDGSEGSYLIYNQSGKINNEGAGRGYARYVDITYQDIPLERLKEIGLRVDWIKWYFPVSNTMLLTSQSLQEENDGVKSERYKSFDESDSTLYYEITRSIVKDSGSGSILPKSQQGFSIKNQWNYGDKNNTIRCKASINGTVYEDAINLRFGKAGTNGTNQTFVIECEENKNALIINDRGVTIPNTLIVTAKIYDSNGKEKELSTEESNKISWSWYKKTNVTEDYIKLPDKRQGQSIKLTCGTNEFKEDNYYILQATYFGDNDNPTLKAYFPVPLKTKNTVKMEGAREVIYNSQGNPSYYSDAYVLYYLKNLKETQVKHGWEIISEDDDNDPMGYLPKLKELGSAANGVGLSASPMYTSGYSDKVCVYIYNEENKYGWAQPILIMKSPYDFPMLNEWDGTLTMNEKNGTILSTMLGAGHKNADNTFSGVLIGDVSAAGGEASETGVYGFHEGEVSYALKEGGTATFGKAGRGQIHIDGNSGTIKSGNYTGDNPAGMKIDLDDGIIDIRSSHEDSNAKVYISPGKDEKGINVPYFSIAGTTGGDIIKIAKDEYCLQSENWIDTGGSEGSYLSLDKGTLDMRSEGGFVSLSSCYDDQGSKEGITPFFTIGVNSDKNLFYCAKDNYYLQSLDYSTGSLKRRLGFIGTEFNDAKDSANHRDLSVMTLVESSINEKNDMWRKKITTMIGYHDVVNEIFIPIVINDNGIVEKYTHKNERGTYEEITQQYNPNKSWDGELVNTNNRYQYYHEPELLSREQIEEITEERFYADEASNIAYFVRRRYPALAKDDKTVDAKRYEIYFEKLNWNQFKDYVNKNQFSIFKSDTDKYQVFYRLDPEKKYQLNINNKTKNYEEYYYTFSNNYQIALSNSFIPITAFFDQDGVSYENLKKIQFEQIDDDLLGYHFEIRLNNSAEIISYPNENGNDIFEYGNQYYAKFNSRNHFYEAPDEAIIESIRFSFCKLIPNFDDPESNSIFYTADDFFKDSLLPTLNLYFISGGTLHYQGSLIRQKNCWIATSEINKYSIPEPLNYSSVALEAVGESGINGEGFLFDLARNEVVINDLKLEASHNHGNFVLNLSKTTNFPLIIGDKVMIDWEGNIVLKKDGLTKINVSQYLLDTIDADKYKYKEDK